MAGLRRVSFQRDTEFAALGGQLYLDTHAAELNCSSHVALKGLIRSHPRFRFFANFQAQPQLAIVTNTLGSLIVELWLFCWPSHLVSGDRPFHCGLHPSRAGLRVPREEYCNEVKDELA